MDTEKDLKMRSALAVVVCLLGVLVTGSSAQNAELKPRKLPISTEARERARRAIPAVGLVLVRNTGDTAAPRPRGSAVLVRRDGLVATNHHVIARDKSNRLYDELYLELPGEEDAAQGGSRRYQLKVMLVDPAGDLALLRVESDASGQPLPEGATFPTVELGDSRALQLLDDLIIIGYPEKGGTTVTVNTGVVEGKDSARDWIKTDARLIHGNSGGAAINAEGKLVGIPTKVVVDSDSNREYGAVGYLRPSHLVAALMAQLETARSPSLGPVVAQARPSSGGASPAPEAQLGPMLRVRGVVKSAARGTPIAGVRVGLVPIGSDVTPNTLIAWGGTNPEGRFELNRAVAPGRYTVRARAFGYEAYAQDVEIKAGATELVIELKPAN